MFQVLIDFRSDNPDIYRDGRVLAQNYLL